MAHCSQCGRDMGCGCNLINGSCAVCYNKSLNGDQPQIKRKRTDRVIYKRPETGAAPNTEFSEILKSQGLSRAEKLKRINDILEQARLQIT